MVRKIQSSHRYVLSILIATLLFINGLVIINGVSFLEYTRVSVLQGDTSYEIFQDKLLKSFFGSDICSENSFEDILEDLAFQGIIINDLEEKFGKDDIKVLERKKFYSLVLLEHYEFLKSYNLECNDYKHSILFFYSNSGEYIDRSEEIGRVLETVVDRNPELLVYSFDIDLDSDIVRNLKMKYSVDKPLTIIIDDSVTIEDFENIGQIENYLP